MATAAALSEPAVEERRAWSDRAAYWLTLALVFSMPWEDVVQFPGFGTVAKLVGMLAAGSWGLHVLAKGHVRTPQLYHGLALFFIVWNGLSLLWTVDADATTAQTKTYAQTLVLVFLLWDLVDTPDRRDAVLQAYVLGAFVSVYEQMMNFQAGVGFTARRFVAGDFHPNNLAFVLALGIPAAAELAMKARAPWLRMLNLAYVPAGFYGVLLTASRAGVVCALVGVGYLVVRVLRARPALRFTLVPAAFAVVVLSLTYAPSRTVERVQDTGGESLDARMHIWKQGLDLFYGRPLQGVGSGTFELVESSGKAPHNFAISVLAELGLPGFLCFLGLLAVTTYHSLKGTEPLLWLTFMAVWFGMAAVHNVEDKKQTWVFFSLAVASQRPIARSVSNDSRAVV